MTKNKILSSFIFLIIIFYIPIQAHSNKAPIVHSYHQRYSWTDELNEGSFSELITKDTKNILYYISLQKFNIDIDNIPKQSIIVDKTDNFYKSHKSIITITIMIITYLSIIIIILSLYIFTRKKYIKALMKSEQKAKHLIDVSPMPILLINAKKDVEYINSKFIELFGYNTKEINNFDHYLYKLYPNIEYRKYVKELWDYCFANNIFSPKEFITTNKKGEKHNIVFHTTPIEDGFFILHENITERLKSMAEIKKQMTVIQNSIDGIGILNEDQKFSYLNQACAEIYGYHSPQELLGKSWRDLYNTQELQRFEKKLIPQIRKIGFWKGEAVGQKKDGSLFEQELSLTSLSNTQAELDPTEGKELVCIIRDISERKQSEKQQKLLEQQLRQAQKLEALGTLTGGIAHDFNNILQGLFATVEIMQYKTQVSDKIKYLKQMEEIIKRGRDLVGQLLTMSHKSKPEFIVLNLNLIITECVNFLNRTLPKTVNIKVEFEHEQAWINADHSQMEQVILNIVNNANDALQKVPNGSISIKTENFEFSRFQPQKYLDISPGKYILLYISDTGSGISQDIIGKIYDPFFTTKEVGKGTGLGLAMAYAIVKAHKGHIVCHSHQGQGTTFKIFIPRVLNKHPKDVNTKPSYINTVKNNETVLIVDDEEILRNLSKEILTSRGYKTLEAKNGEEALQILNTNHNIDKVILDLGMPGMGGETCLKEIKKIKPELPVIVASGYGAHKIRKNPQQFGAKTFIRKPYSVEDLLRALS